MPGAITLTNLPNYTFGVPNDESTINIQKLTVRAFTAKKEVMDRVGRIVGRADTSLKQEYTIEGYLDGASVSGSTLASTTLVGAIITILGISTLGGIASTGAVIIDEPQVDYVTGELAKITYKLTRYNDIPSTATQVNM